MDSFYAQVNLNREATPRYECSIKEMSVYLDKLRYIVIISDISYYIFITQKGASYMFGNKFAFEY
jgi:hypothetical protein